MTFPLSRCNGVLYEICALPGTPERTFRKTPALRDKGDYVGSVPYWASALAPRGLPEYPRHFATRSPPGSRTHFCVHKDAGSKAFSGMADLDTLPGVWN